jgi:2-oxoglutarate ferredoxin oxidoreductase subunit beta
MNPLLIAIASDCGFVARGFAGDPAHLSRLIQEGIRFKGFAFIDILQPCVTFNHVNTFQWYASRVYKINEEPGYDPENRMMAFKGAQEWGERIPIGILYQSKRSTLDEKQVSTRKTPLVKQKVDREAMEKMLGLFR